MEQYPVRKIEKPIDWCVTVPGSKSMTNRALLMAALSDGTVTLDGVLFSDDSRHFISSLTALGFDVLVEEEKRRVTVKGEGGTIPKKEAEIDVGSAGIRADEKKTDERSVCLIGADGCRDYISGTGRFSSCEN